jgi:hypothetical protein
MERLSLLDVAPVMNGTNKSPIVLSELFQFERFLERNTSFVKQSMLKDELNNMVTLLFVSIWF